MNDDGARSRDRIHGPDLQAALERAAFEWRTTFDAIGSPILNLDPDGRVKRLNEAARLLTGKAFQDLISRPVSELGDGELFAHVAELARRAAVEGATVTSQLEAGGDSRTWDLTAHFRRSAEEPSHLQIVVVAHDVSRMVELQKSLRRSETLSALGSLVAGVAHQVRNPLFGISAGLDAFEARFGDREDMRRYVEALREPLGRLSRLLEDLLAYGKPPAVETARYDLGQVAAGAVRSCQPLASSSGVTLALRRPDAPLWVTVDAARLGEAFVNLIENAIQHSAPGQTVEVEATVAADDRGGRARVAVRDHGPGFAAEDLARAVEPFFSRRHGGTGLGLALVQRIVHSNGGRLRLVNADGGGARVTVDLPLVEGD